MGKSKNNDIYKDTIKDKDKKKEKGQGQ